MTIPGRHTIDALPLTSVRFSSGVGLGTDNVISDV